MDDFLTKVQVEEIYDERQLQELNDYYEWLNQQNQLQDRQGRRKDLCEDFDLWESEFESRLSVEEGVWPQESKTELLWVETKAWTSSKT